MLLYLTDRHGTIALQVGGWGPSEPGMGPLGITLVVDRLSALMLVVSSIVLLAVVFYAIGRLPRRRRPPAGVHLPADLPGAVGRRVQRVPGRRPVQPVRRFRGAAFGELRAADHRLQPERVRAGISYVMVSMVSSLSSFSDWG